MTLMDIRYRINPMRISDPLSLLRHKTKSKLGSWDGVIFYPGRDNPKSSSNKYWTWMQRMTHCKYFKTVHIKMNYTWTLSSLVHESWIMTNTASLKWLSLSKSCCRLEQLKLIIIYNTLYVFFNYCDDSTTPFFNSSVITIGTI